MGCLKESDIPSTSWGNSWYLCLLAGRYNIWYYKNKVFQFRNLCVLSHSVSLNHNFLIPVGNLCFLSERLISSLHVLSVSSLSEPRIFVDCEGANYSRSEAVEWRELGRLNLILLISKQRKRKILVQVRMGQSAYQSAGPWLNKCEWNKYRKSIIIIITILEYLEHTIQ